MEENKEGTQQAAQEAYVRQLAELSARVLHMTEEQKQRNAAKIEELNKRVAALPPALRGLYAQQLRSLAPPDAPVQQPPAADAAYEPEYADGYEYEEEDEDEVPARRRKKRKKHGCLIVMLVFLMLAALAAAAGWFWLSGEVSGSRGAAVAQSVTIEKGSGPLAIGQKLQDAGMDPLLIFGVWIFPEMGVEGAAVSTVCGYTFSMILAFYVLIFRKQKVKIKTKGFKLDFKIFKEIFVIGFPSFLMNALGAFMTYFTNLFLVLYSTTAVAFFGAYFKLQQVVIMTLNGLVQGCIPIMSYNYGAKNEKRLTQAFQYGNTIGILLTGVSIIILCLFPSQVLTAFNASEEMLSFGVPALRSMCISDVFAAIATMVASCMQSTKRVKFSLLINILRQFGLLIPAMWLLSKFMGMTGIWYAFIVAEVITAAISWALYKKYPISFDEAA